MVAYADPRKINSPRKRGQKETPIPDKYAAEKRVLDQYFRAHYQPGTIILGRRAYVESWIKTLYCSDAYESMASLARQYGCSRQRVQQLLIEVLRDLARFPDLDEHLPPDCRLRTAIARYTE